MAVTARQFSPASQCQVLSPGPDYVRPEKLQSDSAGQIGESEVLPSLLSKAVNPKLAWRKRERSSCVNWTVREIIILNLTG